MTAFDLDIVRVSRPHADYDLDVFVGGLWVASAKNYHNADETAHEVWYRNVLDQPVVMVNWNSVDDEAPGDDCPDHGPYADDECPKCATVARAKLRPLPTAVTRQSIQFESALQRNRQCAHCGGAHFAA
jgi:hypothetical protein